jgi:3-hydroxybutyryl-CoA dehydratase
MSGATEAFKQQLRIAFDRLQLGQVFTFRRTFTEADTAMFCGVTGDYNPYHIDDLFLADSFFGRKIIPGLLTASMITHIGGMIGFLATEMNFQFAQAVYVGDTITCTVTFIEKDEVRRVFTAKAVYVNQHGVEVTHAQFKGFPADVRLAK